MQNVRCGPHDCVLGIIAVTVVNYDFALADNMYNCWITTVAVVCNVVMGPLSKELVLVMIFHGDCQSDCVVGLFTLITIMAWLCGDPRF
jgi:hypothetical protein